MINKGKYFTKKAICCIVIMFLYSLAIPANNIWASCGLESSIRTDSITPGEKVDSLKLPMVHITAEEMPSYPGGEKAMNQFVVDNLTYPVTAQETGVQGRVTTRFVVTETGDISDAKVIRGVDPACDAEALRVINMMPRWTPGKNNGVAVPVYYTIPIVFRIREENKDIPVNIYNGNEISFEEIRAEYQRLVDSNKDKDILAIDTPLTDEDVKEKYGDKYAGRKVFEITFNMELKKEKALHSGDVDVMPSFPGGDKAMNEYILKNLRYPAIAKKNNIKGRVAVRFFVTETGELTGFTIVRGIDPSCNNEALRVIKSMPKWIPGTTRDGEAVGVYFTLPILFRL
ncbi:MAG: energy transducer TonB [Prevotella sp.]|jgi:TonB family protein|nr:energy transducer TonB [Prevotella sp.]